MSSDYVHTPNTCPLHAFPVGGGDDDRCAGCGITYAQYLAGIAPFGRSGTR